MAEDTKPAEAGPGGEPAAEAPIATLIHHRGWSESILVKKALDDLKVRYRERDVWGEPLSRLELEALLAGVEDLRPFLNPRSSEYRDRGMATRTPPLDMAIELMLRNESLLWLPILVRGDEVKPVPFPEDALAFLGVGQKPAAKAAPAKGGAPAKHGAAKAADAKKTAAPAAAKKAAATADA